MSDSRWILSVLITILMIPGLSAQRLALLHEGNGVSLRGLSVVNPHTIWVSGSKGTVGISSDGGNKWDFFSVAGFENRDFRDIEAFDANTALIMAVDTPALILRTSDRGKTWKTVFEDHTPGMFLDAMDFRNATNGVVIGDPIRGRLFESATRNGGRSWKTIGLRGLPAIDSGEACFAASGTNIRVTAKGESYFVTGGKRSRLFHNNVFSTIPVSQGEASQGANSIALCPDDDGPSRMIIVGGDFNNDTARTGNCAISDDRGHSWLRPSNPPFGYRSCVEYLGGRKWIACGLTGVDFSFDDGINWNNISSTGFHVCRKARDGDAVFLAGSDGRIGKIVF